MMPELLRRLLLAALVFFAGREVRALDLVFDYSLDSNSFFSGANMGRRTFLDGAAQVFELRLADTLDAIIPSGSNTWTPAFSNPSTGLAASVPANPTIAQNEIRIYVGARALPGSTLGIGGPGGYSAGGNQAWFDKLEARGESGGLATPATDFGPWGGAVSFDIDASWYFDSDPGTVEAGALSGKDDFFSTAVHEIGHLLGIGTADSWDADVSGSFFEGANAKASNGGLHVALSGDLGHWAEGTSSKVFGTNTNQEAAMDPSILVGSRKYFTNLDFAGLQDIGWVVVPEPASGTALALGG